MPVTLRKVRGKFDCDDGSRARFLTWVDRGPTGYRHAGNARIVAQNDGTIPCEAVRHPRIAVVEPATTMLQKYDGVYRRA